MEMRNLSVLIELAANNCFQSRQGIGSSHSVVGVIIVITVIMMERGHCGEAPHSDKPLDFFSKGYRVTGLKQGKNWAAQLWRDPHDFR